NSVSDAGVGALAAVAGVRGAYLNVQINVDGLDDKTYVEKVLKDGQEIVDKSMALEKEILIKVEEVINK
ncbi:MAG TPA: cyclodeaminase/cyclohydrolase family protein, partial [Bacteroidales bacterium]|nr:cyclodeaminase/cyclohydrolase family protein [Bacteroidales bacterium]